MILCGQPIRYTILHYSTKISRTKKNPGKIRNKLGILESRGGATFSSILPITNGSYLGADLATTVSCFKNSSNFAMPSPFMKISATRSIVFTYFISISPNSTYFTHFYILSSFRNISSTGWSIGWHRFFVSCV